MSTSEKTQLPSNGIVQQLRSVDPQDVSAVIQALGAAADRIEWLQNEARRWNIACGHANVAAARAAHETSPPLTRAATDVLAERQRQVTGEGWTPEHDDKHTEYELARAASAYALRAAHDYRSDYVREIWPWSGEWWKPTNRRRSLVKAGALILAEIERHDRAAGLTVETATDPAESVPLAKFLQYRSCLYRANGRLIQLGQEPEKLEYPNSTAEETHAMRCTCNTLEAASACEKDCDGHFERLAEKALPAQEREWSFNRYRAGRLMAQGVKVRASTFCEAWLKAKSCLHIDGNKPTDELRLSENGSEQ
jgi:hypothetical protein